MSASKQPVRAGSDSAAGEATVFVGLSFLLLATGYAFVQAAVMAIALPEISASLDISPATGTLAATVMIAMSGATLISCGRAADRVGRRKVCLLGILVVIGASILAALAWNGLILVLARAIQGVGIAMLLTSISLVSVLFEGSDRRGLAFGLLAASVGIGTALAPLIASGALALGSWRMLFWLNVPVLAVAYIGIRRTVAESRDEHAQGSDVPGSILLSVGLLAGLLYVLRGGQAGWLLATPGFQIGVWVWRFPFSPAAPLLLAAIVGLFLFAYNERQRAERSLAVMMDTEVFRNLRFALGCAVSFLFVLGGFALLFIVPIFGRELLHEDSVHVALLTATIGMGITVGGLVAAPIGRRLGDRFVVVGGLVLMASMLGILLALVSDTLDYGSFAAVLLLCGTGYGMVYAKITEVALTDVPRPRIGVASGMLVASRTYAMAIGAAALSMIMLLNKDGTPALSQDESGAALIAFGLSLGVTIGALIVALAIPRDTGTQADTRGADEADIGRKHEA